MKFSPFLLSVLRQTPRGYFLKHHSRWGVAVIQLPGRTGFATCPGNSLICYDTFVEVAGEEEEKNCRTAINENTGGGKRSARSLFLMFAADTFKGVQDQ